MKRIFLFFLLCAQLGAADYYAKEGGAGAGTGADLANAATIASLNAHTASGDDNLILNGTITSPIVAHNGGTSGHPVNYVFATGAAMSKPTWFQSGSNGDSAFYINGMSDITIDGANVGLIQCTDNGTGKGHSDDCIGILVNGACSRITIKRLTIGPIYLRTQGSENIVAGNCVKFSSGTGTGNVIDSCVLNNASSDVFFAYDAGAGTFEIKNSTLSASGEGVIVIGSTSGSSSFSSVLLHDCDLEETLAWSGQSAIHTNLIHANAVHTGAALTGLRIYNNKFHGYFGSNPTSWVFLEGYVDSPLVYCNVFAPVTNDFNGNGTITVKGTQTAIVSNNTFYGVNDGVAVGTTTFGALGIGLVLRNNVVFNFAIGFYDELKVWQTTGASYDYDVFYPTGTTFFAGTGQDTFAQMKTELSPQISGGIGGETHATQSTPNLDSNYYPVAPSSAIGTGSNFADMSAYYTLDRFGQSFVVRGWGGGAQLPQIVTTGGTTISGNIKFSGNFQIK